MGPGDVIGQTYEVVRRLGAGGMGAVFEAKHLRLPKRVAIKVLTTSLDPELVARFHQEAQIASSLGNPHIVDVIDLGTLPSGVPYMVMELLEGESLRQRMRRGQQPIAEIVRILRQIASALYAAHRANVIHRDLKPENIFLQAEGVSGIDHVKLLDFGVSKIQGAAVALTAKDLVLGTPAYMSPEQATGDTKLIDARVDQFALAMIGYEMLAGLPFPIDDTTRLMQRIAFERIPPLRAPDAPRYLVATIERALSQHPRERFASMAELLDALDGKEVSPAEPTDRDSEPPREPTAVTERPTVSERPPVRPRRARWPILLALFVMSVGVTSAVLVLRRSSNATIVADAMPIDTALADASIDVPLDAPPDAAIDAPPIDAAPIDAAPIDARRPATTARTDPEVLKPEVAEDLARAQAALNANDAANATRYARRTLEIQPTRRAYLILVEVACRANDLAAARGWMRTMPAAVIPRAKNICAALGLEL